MLPNAFLLATGGSIEVGLDWRLTPLAGQFSVSEEDLLYKEIVNHVWCATENYLCHIITKYLNFVMLSIFLDSL